MPAVSPQLGAGSASSRAGVNGATAVHPTQIAAAKSQGAVKKKVKAKKTTDPSETEKLLAAKINQLELDKAGEKDQEQEIEREVRRATRDLNNLLAGMGTPLERMEALQKRIADLMGEMKRVEKEHVKGKKRADQLQKERDTQRVELNKTTSMKDKLEKLARELTKENKKLKDDVKRLEDNQQRTRDATSIQDSLLIAHHETIMDSHRKVEPSKSSAELDEMFRQKFKSFFDQYNLRELHFLSVLRAKDNEIQHYLARLENQKKVADNETTRARQLTTQVSTFSQTETELRSQLNIYVEKFKQVEDTLNNSNDLFLTFRKEMEEMSKKTKRLEKENLNLTRKHELTNRNVLEMVEERTRMQKELDSSHRKTTTLESIIRQMQGQGRDPGSGAPAAATNVDDDGTESDYEDSEAEYEVGSGEAEYDDETEDELSPPPLPPPASQNQGLRASTVPVQAQRSRKSNGRTHRIVNGAVGHGSRQVEV